jgi:oxygen-independent coproporphyrinogen-3 oxidase
MPWAELTPLSPREALEERALLGLRATEGLPVAVLAGLELAADTDPLAGLIADGFLTLETGHLAATVRGRPLLDALLGRLLT